MSLNVNLFVRKMIDHYSSVALGKWLGVPYPHWTPMMDSIHLNKVILPRLSRFNYVIMLCIVSAYEKYKNAICNCEQEIESTTCVRLE